MKTVSGLDVHKDTIFCCIMQEDGTIILKEYGTLTAEIELLRDDLLSCGVSRVAMESTGIYWIPVWRILEEKFRLTLVNPYYIKQVPGKKTDVKDAQWIATLLQKELLKDSMIPDEQIRTLREYERRYVHLCGQCTRAEQEIERQLIKCNIRISSLASQIGSQSVMKVVEAITRGEIKPEQLIVYVHGRIKNKHGINVSKSLTGTITDCDVFILKQIFSHHQLICQQQRELIFMMEKICQQHYKEEMEILKTMTGMQTLSAMQFIAETGADMSKFPTANHLVSWAGLRPRNDESAGKIKSKKITHGNKYLRRTMVQTAWAASRTKNSFFKNKFETLCARKSRKKALIAIARKQLVVAWNMLSKKQVYQQPVVPMEEKQRKIKYHQKQLEKLLQAEKVG